MEKSQLPVSMILEGTRAMAPSSNQPPTSHPSSSSLNTLLQKKAKEARDARTMGYDGMPLAESSESFSHAVVDILPRPRTKMNRSQSEADFDEGDYCPIEPEDLKQATRFKRQAERSQRRQKLVIQKRRVKKRRRVFLKRLKRLSNLAAFFLLAILIWVMVVNPMWVFTPNSPIQLHNTRLITQAHLQPVLKAFQNKPIFNVDPQAIEKSIQKQYPIVEHLYVRRSLFPARLDITLIERTPFAAIYASPFAAKPASLATFESDTNHYDVVKLAPYPYDPAKNTDVPKLVMPAGYRLEQSDWQRIDTLLGQLKQLRTFPFQAVEMVPIPKTEKQKIPLMAVIHYPDFIVFAGPLDPEMTQRVARLPVLMPKIQEMQDAVQGVDLRWSEQITFIKKGAPLPIGMKVLSQQQKEIDARKAKEAEEKAAAALKESSSQETATKPVPAAPVEQPKTVASAMPNSNTLQTKPAEDVTRH